MRALIIDQKAKQKVSRLLQFASKEQNWYRPDETLIPPGDNPDFVIHLNSFRCVFTYTFSNDELFRHLSISVPAKNKYPHQIAALTIAELFGFSGWDGVSAQIPSGWIVGTNKEEGCVTMVQQVEQAA
jgi:hypothetical protein